jgi:hypothetical protein
MIISCNIFRGKLTANYKVQEGTLRILHHATNTIRMEGAIPFMTGQAGSQNMALAASPFLGARGRRERQKLRS